MKKYLLLTFALVCSLACFASAKVKEGSLACLSGEKTISVCLDLTDTKYKKKRPLDEFLLKERRVDDWEKQSLDYFVTTFNQRSVRYGFKVAADSQEEKYILVLASKNVNGNGSLEGEAYLKEKGSSETKAVIEFSSDDGDDDDEITFRDPLKELGETFAKIFVKEIKKAQK